MINRDVELAHQAGVLGGFKDLHPDMVEFVKLIRADEREECAKVCEQPIDEIQMTNEWSEYVYMDGQECADAIRARALHDMNKAAEDNGEPL